MAPPKYKHVKIMHYMETDAGFLRKLFDEKAFIRVRLRVKKGKRMKVRNIRLSSTDADLVLHAKQELVSLGIKPSVYKIGSSLCIDIEGKMKLERFASLVGFLDEGKKQRLAEAIKPLSLSS